MHLWHLPPGANQPKQLTMLTRQTPQTGLPPWIDHKWQLLVQSSWQRSVITFLMVSLDNSLDSSSCLKQNQEIPKYTKYCLCMQDVTNIRLWVCETLGCKTIVKHFPFKVFNALLIMFCDRCHIVQANCLQYGLWSDWMDCDICNMFHLVFESHVRL